MYKGDLFLPYFFCKSLAFSIFMCYNINTLKKGYTYYEEL